MLRIQLNAPTVMFFRECALINQNTNKDEGSLPGGWQFWIHEYEAIDLGRF